MTPTNLREAALAGAACLVLFALPFFWIIDVMKYFVILLAIWLATRVYDNPKEAVSAGALYLIACNVILPSTARLDWNNQAEPWEMYYWAAGLLIITLAAIHRIGLKKIVQIPRSLGVFVLVALAAAVVGYRNGASFSNASRQLYGSLLFAAYFSIAYHVGDEGFFLQRLRKFGLYAAIGFFVYYAAVWDEYGFHKEISSLPTLIGAVAIMCVVKGLFERGNRWIISGLVLLSIPVLLFERRMMVTFVVGVALALAIKASSRHARMFYGSVAIAGILLGILPFGAEYVMEGLKNIPGVEDVLPTGGADANSLLDRGLELFDALDVIRKSPALGDGFGNEFAWDSATRGNFAQTYVDNGWAYIAVKMGGLGLLTFGWFLFSLLPCISPKSLALSVCLLSSLLVTMFSEPVFLNFNTSALFGAMAGLLYATKYKEESADAVSLAASVNLTPARRQI